MRTLTSSDKKRQKDRWEKQGGLNLALGYPILSPVHWELGSLGSISGKEQIVTQR